MSTVNVFHEGELAVQERVGATAQGQNSGRMIAARIIPGAIKFVRKQPLLVVGSVDVQNDLLASLIVGRPGFMVAEPGSLELNLSQVVRVPHDLLWQNLIRNPRIGLLVIDLRTRARLRVNGRAEFTNPNRLHISVEQAYPNCPKYIQRRNFQTATNEISRTEFKTETGTVLNEVQQRWIAGADTLFVASGHTACGVDASHRGGNPGFIQVLSTTRLRIPDYEGNGMFNTLGNFAANPKAGLLIPDFETGRTLQLTGHVDILWDVEDPEDKTGGTRRYWDFTIDRWIQIENSLPGSSDFLDYSPHNPNL